MALLAPNTVFSLTLVFGLLLGDVKALLGAVRLDRSPPNTAPCRSTTRLWGKVSRSRNKQAELARKLAEAKRQNQSQDPSHASSLSDEEIKERNDRQRFEELLQQKGSTVLNDFSADGYLTRQQEEEEIRAVRSGVDRLFEGDPAPTDCFEELVSIKSENAIGKAGAERLVPWLRKNSARHGDYLLILCDPRIKSPELRQTVQSLRADLTADICSHFIVINADSPAENRRWLKKDGLEDKVDVFSDEKMEWMRSYTALGENRWSMTMFIIQGEKIAKLAREVDFYGASRTIKNAVNSLNEARL